MSSHGNGRDQSGDQSRRLAVNPAKPGVAQLVMSAAHGQMMTALSHELLNQQNGIQVNGQLIRALAASDRSAADELIAASDRLVADSKRSVSMFVAARALGLALRGVADEPRNFRVASALPELLQAVRGHAARKVELRGGAEQTLPAAFIVGLGALLVSLMPEAVGQIDLSIGKEAVVLSWDAGSAEQAREQLDSIKQADVVDPWRAALPLWLAEEKLDMSSSVSGCHCEVAMDLPA